MASIFQRGKKAVWWIKYYASGRQVYYSLRTTSERAARRIKRQIEGEQAKGELLAPSQIPLPAFLEDFCKFLATIRTSKSFKNDLSVLRVLFGPVCPALEPGSCVNKRWRAIAPGAGPGVDTMRHVHIKAEFLEDVTTTTIETFLARRIREDGIAAKTANRFHEVLHRMFNYAIKSWRFVAADRRYPNPAAPVERRREPARTIRFLSQPEIDEQLEVLRDDTTLYAAVATLIYGGFRREEILWLTVEDVNPVRRLIYVRAKTVDREFWQPKTKRNRVVPISEALLGVLDRYQPARTGPWFFPSPASKRWDPDNFSERLRNVNRDHDLVWSCLDFRHTFGSHLAQKGESLYKIATLMGNSEEICRKHYAALDPEQMHDAVEFGPTPDRGPSGREPTSFDGQGQPRLRLVR